MKPSFVIELLSDHDRVACSCGALALDRYFKTQVSQDMRRHVTNCFVAREAETETIAGYYTITAASTPTPDLPEVLRK